MIDHAYVFLEEETSFSEKEFMTPSQAYAPSYNWVWNAPVSKEQTDEQLAEIKRLGIRTICILPEPKDFSTTYVPTRLEPDYLTKAYFEAYTYAAQKAEEMGMHLWLYDEGGWPSGGACNRVLYAHPEYAQKKLAFCELDLPRGAVYQKNEEILLAITEDGETVENGYVAKQNIKIKEYFVKRHFFGISGHSDLPDLSIREATECFIDMTHEAYKPYIGKLLGKSMRAVFTDEARLAVPFPYSERLEAEFEKRNGYSIRPYIPELMRDRETGEEAAKAKIAWFDMLSELFCTNYLLPEKRWTNAHGMSFTGHFGREEIANGCMIDGGIFHLMRCLRCLDIPGIDVIWRQIFPGKKENPLGYRTHINGFFPRYASSAAAQIGTTRAMTESLGVYGQGLTFDEMRYVMNYQAVRGINVYNVFSVPYGREGFLMSGELPFFTEKMPCYSDLPAFNRYLERLSYVTSLGYNVSDVAIYMPMHDFWADGRGQDASVVFEKIGKSLEDEQILFDIFDDDVMKCADENALSSGKIVMGFACYRTLIIPPCKFLPVKTAEKLSRFVAGGGTVYILSGYEGPGISGALTVESIDGELKSCIEISGERKNIRLGVRKAENGTMYLLFNEDTSMQKITVSLPNRAIKLDLGQGKMVQLSDSESYTFDVLSGELVCLWCGEGTENAENEAHHENELMLEDKFTFKRQKQLCLGKVQYEEKVYKEGEKEIFLGDWKEAVGADYSGSCIYKTTFMRPKNKGEVLLDLGEVHYSCEVFLNGKSQGVRIMTPYRYTLRAEEMQDENILEIRVSNTPANEYHYSKNLANWARWQLSSYWPIQDFFHEDSLSGGLYGPVKLLF